MALVKAQLSCSESRRETVIQSAIAVFAERGYLGTPIADVAKHARISQAYVFKLFPSKEELFVAALERCFQFIERALAEGADSSKDQQPDAVLFAMGGAYAALIADQDLLKLQVHAQSVAGVPKIASTFRKGLKATTTFAKKRSGASDEAVQRFMAYGQLCHLITVMRLDEEKAAWAQILTKGIRHP